MARYYRRGHWVNAPSSRGGGKASGWLIAGLIALALLFAARQHGGDSDGAEPAPAPSGQTTGQTSHGQAPHGSVKP